ncbi:protein FAM177A1 [Trichoplusia ni]|uniref:Protein FAM177A1 n=1 Tax=Trichoplusia ni TaxID=7111 RepID=A0A7E5VPP3_TRINI|nr:protein FAM177A1 [Trichoplusia ni]
MENTETQVTIKKPGRVLHFSDGVEEEIETEEASELACEPEESEVDPKSLTWGPWFSHYAWKSGSKVLNAVDYAGESLAGFFGITTPKYQLEISEYERMKEEKRKMDEETAGWVPKNGGGDIPLVLNEPGKEIEKAEEV